MSRGELGGFVNIAISAMVYFVLFLAPTYSVLRGGRYC